MFKKTAAFLTVIIILISCTDPVDPDNPQNGIILSTLNSGTILEHGINLPLTLLYSQENDDFDYVLITLFNDEGVEIAGDRIDKEVFDSARRKDLALPENLDKGVYHIRFDVVYRDNIVLSKLVNFFHSDTGYRITSLQTFPPDPAPDENVFIYADFTAPPGTDPWFRWKLGNNTVSEGFFSAEGNRLKWKVPPREGVFPISVEMFPFKPSDKIFQSFISSINSESVIFSSSSGRQKSSRFGPEESYITLFNFRGEISNTGYGSAGRASEDTEVSGKPYFDFDTGIYGYYFGKNDHISIPYISLPVTDRNQPGYATINFKFLPDYTAMKDLSFNNEAAPFFSVENFDKSFSAELGLTGIGEYYFTITEGNNSYTGRAVDLLSREKEIINLSVSLYPENDSTVIVWSINGNIAARDRAPIQPVIPEGRGRTVIGSRGGFAALISEAGVYTKDSSSNNSCDPFVFSNYFAERAGRNLVLAEGFESVFHSSRFKVSGNPQFRNGLAELKPGETILLSENSNGLELPEFIEIKASGDCDIIIKDETGAEVFAMNLSERDTAVFKTENRMKYHIFAANQGSMAVRKLDSILILRNTGSTAADNVLSAR